MFNKGNYKLGDVCQIRKGKHYPKTNNPQFWNGSYPWLTIGDIEKQISKTSKTLTQKGVETVSDHQSYVFKRDTFVVACYGTLGKVGWLNGNFYSSANLINLDSGNRVTNKYLFYWFLKNQEQIKQLGVGSAIQYVEISEIKRKKINLPSFQEQKQIINIIEPLEKMINLINKSRIKTEKFIASSERNKKFFYLKQVARIIKNKKRNTRQVSAKVFNQQTCSIKSWENNGTYNHCFFCPKNTLLIGSIRTYLKKFAILPENADVNSSVFQLEINQNYVSIIHNLLNNDFWNQAEQYAKGSTFPVLSKQDLLENIKFFSIKKEFENLYLVKFLVCLNNLKIKLNQLQNQLVELIIG